MEAGNICSVSVFFVRVGSQISPRRAKKDSNIPSPGRTRSVKCPTPGTTKTIKSPPHALLPPPPPPPPRRLYIDRCTNFWPILLRTELHQTYRQVHCKGWGYGQFYTNHCILSTWALCLNLFVTGNYVAKVYCIVSRRIRKTSSFWLFIMWSAKLYHALFPKKDKIEIWRVGMIAGTRLWQVNSQWLSCRENQRVGGEHSCCFTWRALSLFVIVA